MHVGSHSRHSAIIEAPSFDCLDSLDHTPAHFHSIQISRLQGTVAVAFRERKKGINIHFSNSSCRFSVFFSLTNFVYVLSRPQTQLAMQLFVTHLKLIQGPLSGFAHAYTGIPFWPCIALILVFSFGLL